MPSGMLAAIHGTATPLLSHQPNSPGRTAKPINDLTILVYAGEDFR
jgi:hypothetical protein